MMKYLYAVVLAAVAFTSCEKKEDPISLPPKTGAELATVNMGSDYTYQIFFSFDHKEVLKNEIRAWDLAFQCGPDEKAVYTNQGKSSFVYHTGLYNFAATSSTSSIVETNWTWDDANGDTQQTAIGPWDKQPQPEVMIIRQYDGTQYNYYKIQVLEANASGYKLAYGPSDATTPSIINIPKDPAYNYIYFSFADGGKVLNWEPPKDQWDFVFTRFHHYFEVEKVHYEVNGALLNPYKTSALKDSLTNFTDINQAFISNKTCSYNRDVIGFDWKYYDFNTGRYVTVRKYNYIVKTQDDRYFKLHFLDFLNQAGEKGYPKFEYERIN